MIARLRRSDVLLHGAIVFGGVVVSNVFNYLFYVVIGRLGSVENYGEILALSSLMLLIGAPSAVGQFVVAGVAADLDARGDRAALRRLGDIVTTRMLAVGVVIIVVSVLVRDPVAHFLRLADSRSVVATAAALATLFAAYVPRGVLQGAHRFDDFSASLGFEAVSRVTLGVALSVRFGATGALGGVALGMGLTVAFNWWRFHVRFGDARAPIVFRRSTLMRTIGGVGSGQLALTAATFYDVPLVKHAFDARSAGLYAAAALVGRAVLAAGSFVPTIVLPKTTARVASGRSPFPLLVKALGIAAVPIAITVLAALIAPGLVLRIIVGRAFGDAAPLVLPYVLASSALALATVVAAYNFGLHRYAFIAPMCAAAIIEVATVSCWHPTAAAVVSVIAVGHTAIFVSTFYRINAPLTGTETATRADDEEPLMTPEPVM